MQRKSPGFNGDWLLAKTTIQEGTNQIATAIFALET
jgi:hypothetical protein